MAAITAERTPPASSACSPAMVVPPGDATLSFNRAGCSPVSSTCLAAPSTVCAASVKAVSRGSPIFTPPSARASMIWNTYAGPLPLRPVTASINRSSTTTTVPTASNNRTTRACSSTDTAGEIAMADAPPRTRRHPFRQETCQHGVAHVPAADDRDLDHSPPAHGLYPTGRGPKSAVPMRTNVAPSSTATSKSPDMPMDSSRIETPGILSACASAANIRNRRKCGRASSGAPAAGGMAISPSTRTPFKAPTRSVTRANSSGLNPCLVFSSATFTSSRIACVSPRSLAARSRRSATSSRSTACSSAKRPTAALILFVWSGPIRCHSIPAWTRAPTSSILASASWTRFSPNTRHPFVIASRRRSTGTDFDTATRVTQPGSRPARRAARSMRARTSSSRLLKSSPMPGRSVLFYATGAGLSGQHDGEPDPADHAAGPGTFAAIRVEEVGMAGRAEAHAFDPGRCDADLLQLTAVEPAQVKVGFRPLHVLHDLGPVRTASLQWRQDSPVDLVATDADGRADGRSDRPEGAAKPVLHDRYGLGNDAAQRAPPPGMHRGGHAADRVQQEDRHAVGRLDGDQHPRLIGHDRVIPVRTR